MISKEARWQAALGAFQFLWSFERKFFYFCENMGQLRKVRINQMLGSDAIFKKIEFLMHTLW